ncbi:hypothetical protein CGRA01v4_01577 [Colletotrichum graminicola]|nr:hypothetical protein CGRA01v4_01577 [Colletotrichum graminicola]
MTVHSATAKKAMIMLNVNTGPRVPCSNTIHSFGRLISG